MCATDEGVGLSSAKVTALCIIPTFILLPSISYNTETLSPIENQSKTQKALSDFRTKKLLAAISVVNNNIIVRALHNTSNQG